MPANTVAESADRSTATPLLEAGGHGDQQGRKRGWWNKLLDMEEAKNQVLFSLPMILTNVCYYMIPLISVMLAGHLGELELAGATLANSWATVTGFALMKFELTWEGFSIESFHYVLAALKLALPSAAMVCLEYWAFEILVLLAGLMPKAEQTTSLTAMCVNTEAIAYMITYGLSAAASTRVSNELGAGNPDNAKKAMAVTLKLSVLLGLLVVLALAFGHNIWAGFFSDSSAIIKLFASMTPFLAISIMADSVQGVLSGVARGCGFQHLAMDCGLA